MADNRYAIGIFNKEKGTFKILPTPIIHMQRSIKALKAKAARSVPDTPSKAERCDDKADIRFLINEEHWVKHSDQKEQNQQFSPNEAVKLIQRHLKVSLLRSMTISKLQLLIYHLKVHPTLTTI